jgi:hypothetical protein
MSTASERAKDRRSLRLEFLEDRKLLSLVKPSSVAAELVVTTPANIPTISGRIGMSLASAGLYIRTQPGFTSFSGHGHATPVGGILFSLQQIQTSLSTSPLTITNGTALLITESKGNKIDLSYSGTGQAIHRGVFAVSLTGTVTGGTDGFTGAGGTFTATGTLNAHTGRFNLKFNLALTYP